MRIVAGKHGGRTLVMPKTRATRPMTEKVRGALFDILGPIDGFRVLDAYAGSGALGFEALSRGASHVTAIELGQEASTSIRRTIEQLGVREEFKLEQTKVETWLKNYKGKKFNLIFVMPPYAIQDKIIFSKLGQLLAQKGILIIEYPRQANNFEIKGLQEVDRRSYGDPQLVFYSPAL